MTKRRPFQLREIKVREVPPGDAEMLSPTVDTGVSKSKAVVLEIDLERIKPDFIQPRRVLPSDLHSALRQGEITCRKAIEELLGRRESDNVAKLILEGTEDASGLLDLAESIGEVGLRQPTNVYEGADLDHPTGISYRIGEGERRYWAHWLLVLGGQDEFTKIRCVVEKVVPDDMKVRVRQLAENAVRQDLPAIARARAILGLKTGLARGEGIEVSPDASLQELGDAITKARYRGSATRVAEATDEVSEAEEGLATRVAEVPDAEGVAGVPDSHELDNMVGQTLRRFTGKAVSGQMVRNYLALLRLPQPVRELADAAGLREFRLRPVVSLDDPDQQLRMVERTVEEGLSGRQVDELVKEAKAHPEQARKVVEKTKVKGLTPQGLKRRTRSTISYIEKQMETMGGVSCFLAELSTVEEYGEALDGMVRLRDLLTQILEEIDAPEYLPGSRKRSQYEKGG